jgi:hypothetical protein
MGTGGTKPPRLTTSPIATLPGDSGSMLKTARTALANLRKPWLALAQFIGITEPCLEESTHFATETRLAHMLGAVSYNAVSFLRYVNTLTDASETTVQSAQFLNPTR